MDVPRRSYRIVNRIRYARLARAAAPVVGSGHPEWLGELSQKLDHRMLAYRTSIERRRSSPALKGASQRLIPWLRRGDAEDLLLPVAHVQVEMREELRLGKGIGRVDAEVGVWPGRASPGCAAHLDPPADAQAVCQAGMQPRRKVEIPLPLEPVPQRITQRRLRHGFRPAASVLVITMREAHARGSFRQVIPAVPPGQLNRTLDDRRGLHLAAKQPRPASGPP